ncbi:MAG: hypothetical protein I8H91_02740 [Burkholderiales bacterium]|nr:hypothetical protein [Burkholderiales bacterium]
MHLYTTDINEPTSGRAGQYDTYGWFRVGILGYASLTAVSGTQPLHRWRHPVSNLHFYTVDSAGEAASTLGYVYERLECHVLQANSPGAVPAFRFYDAEEGDHYFSRQKGGEGLGRYAEEGIGFYVFPEKQPDTSEIWGWSTKPRLVTYCLMLKDEAGKILARRTGAYSSFQQAMDACGKWARDTNAQNGHNYKFFIDVSEGACP